MYQFPQSLPAPYMMNQSQGSPVNQSIGLAKGGRAKHHKMIIAHFNPKELDILDHLQGKDERCPKSGIRTYTHLEELLKNPHIRETVHHHARHHAMGGDVSMPYAHHLAAGGRHGDTELGLIGPHTHHFFNQMAGHATHNPHTGHPEYFNLGEALSGLWNGIKGGAGWLGNKAAQGGKWLWNTARPALQDLGANALGELANKYIPGSADLVKSGAHGLANAALGPQEPQSGTQQALAQGLSHGLTAYKGGANAGQALGQGLMGTGNQLGGRLGEGLIGAGSAFNRGQGLGGALHQGVMGAMG